MMQQRRKHKEKQCDRVRDRDRTERSYPARENSSVRSSRSILRDGRIGIAHSSGTSTHASTSPALDQRMDSAEVPALVTDEPLPENPDACGDQMAPAERHGFVDGNMLTTAIETDCLCTHAHVSVVRRHR